RIAPRLETAFLHFPKLAEAGIKKVVNGPFTFAPDGNPLVGPVPGVRNFWAACGVMAGFCQGAGVGKVFADWLTEGEPGMDVFAMDVARYGEFATRKYTVAKVSENFGRRFQVSYPNEELPAMRPWRTTALYEHFARAGAVFGNSFGLEHVLWHAKPGEAETPTFLRSNAHPATAEEVRAAREKVGYIETANFAKHAIFGAAAESFLDKLLACRMPKTGRIKLAPLLSEKGKLIGDLSVAKLGENDFLLFGSGAAQLAHQRHFLARMPKSGVQIENRSAQLHGLSVAGPLARKLLQKLTRENISAAAFRFMDIKKMEIGGVPALVARMSFTGELGYEIYCAPDYLLALHNAVLAAGKDLGLRPFGAYAFMSMRLEKGFGAWGLDFREDFTAAESGLDIFIDLEKPANFIGKAAAMAAAKNPKRRRVLLEVDAVDADANGDEPVYKDGKNIGFITSGGFGHHIGKSLAMGYVNTECAKEGYECAVEILGDKRPAKIRLRPPYDPDGKKMRG
ncbi:MAG: FAD-dependent oxidoreductase, partial [Betaproteobacteria bacterium]|nr:FAD-dependent oxidoreductase [Betaproteobacteria bacterium]